MPDSHSDALPSTQRAWVLRKAGKPRDILKLEDDYPVPKPLKNQLLIKIHAASMNTGGYIFIGLPVISWMHTKPAVPEFEFSGVIVGGDVEGSDLSLGQEVFGVVDPWTIWRTGNGTLAQYTIVDRSLVALKPANISHAEAAAFPAAGLTAYYFLVIIGGLKKREDEKERQTRVFINGGSGGVGTWAVQLAKAYGAFVVTTCSPESKSLVTSLNPDIIIDYRSVSSLPDYLASTFPIASTEPFDLILDTVGVSALYYASPAYLSPDGIYLDIAGSNELNGPWDVAKFACGLIGRMFRPVWAGGVPRRYCMKSPRMGDIVAGLHPSIELLKEGKMKAAIDHVYPFEDIFPAYDRMMSRRTKGKLIISVIEP